MTPEFKVGDRVVLVKPWKAGQKGATGTITGTSFNPYTGQSMVRVVWDPWDVPLSSGRMFAFRFVRAEPLSEFGKQVYEYIQSELSCSK